MLNYPPNSIVVSQNYEPLVSVGIPTYNRPDGLRRTLECITRQTYMNLEIIVSDNCSPSMNTQAVVKDFMAMDTRIQYYRQDFNRGSFFNFHFVLKKATGEYFMWAADDDEWEPFFVGRIIKEFEFLGKDFTAINFEAQYIDSNNKKFKYFAEGEAFYNFYSQSIISRLIHIIKFNYGNLVYSIYRISSIKNIQNVIFVENEIPFLLQIMQYGNWRVIPEVGFYKKTNNTTYIQANWEICGGRLSKSYFSIWHFITANYHSFRYHLIACLKINYSINSLNLSISQKIFLMFYVILMISTHFLKLLFRFK